jgi:RNA polymerase sigma-70 factor (ECF subfamily)
MALALTRNRADAEDLLQETFTAAFRGLGTFSGRSALRTWLVTILMRKHSRTLRSTRHHRATLRLSDPDGAKRSEGAAYSLGSSGTSTAESVERRIHVLEAIRSLTPQHREVLTLREIQGLSYEEIAAVLGVSQSTVESRLFRARREFRERFGEFDSRL